MVNSHRAGRKDRLVNVPREEYLTVDVEELTDAANEELEHGNLALVKIKALGDGIELARYVSRTTAGGETEGEFEFFGTALTHTIDQVEVVQKVAAVWV
ncbi:hypothetical protein [Actinoplanes sp. NPDC026670]|uniref:hypothetical protein n=1 Tax=Actinoplanes sp. NPDC026670 TaxID=3154700 RepID=UPI0034087D56